MLKDANYRGYVVLEYESAPDPYEAIPKHLASCARPSRRCPIQVGLDCAYRGIS
jgi:hypothetical protein